MEQQNKTTAIYCRVACADELAMEIQKQFLIWFAKEQGISDITFYEDNGYSGLNLDRPAFSQMDADMIAGKIKAVIVKDETRIGRCIIQVLYWMDKAQSSGVQVITTAHTDNTLLNTIYQSLIGCGK